MFLQRQAKRRLSFFINEFESFKSSAFQGNNALEKMKFKYAKSLNNYTRSIINRTLNKYQSTKTSFEILKITQILDSRSALHKKFEEMLIVIDTNEFLHKFYDHSTSTYRLAMITVFITNLEKLYPSYIGLERFHYSLMLHFLLDKQKIIDDIFQKQKPKQKKEAINISEIDDLHFLKNDSESISSYSECEYRERNKGKVDSVESVQDLIQAINIAEKKNEKATEEEKQKAVDDVRIHFSNINKRKGHLMKKMLELFDLPLTGENPSKRGSKMTKEELVKKIQRSRKSLVNMKLDFKNFPRYSIKFPSPDADLTERNPSKFKRLTRKKATEQRNEVPLFEVSPARDKFTSTSTFYANMKKKKEAFPSLSSHKKIAQRALKLSSILPSPIKFDLDKSPMPKEKFLTITLTKTPKQNQKLKMFLKNSSYSPNPNISLKASYSRSRNLTTIMKTPTQLQKAIQNTKLFYLSPSKTIKAGHNLFRTCKYKVKPS